MNAGNRYGSKSRGAVPVRQNKFLHMQLRKKLLILSAHFACSPILSTFLIFNELHLHMNRSSAVTAGLHAAGWILFYSMIILFITNGGPDGNTSSIDLFTLPVFVFTVIFPSIFYMHRFLFIPYLLEQKRYFLYILVFGLVLYGSMTFLATRLAMRS